MRVWFSRWQLSLCLVSWGECWSQGRELIVVAANHIRPKGTRTIPPEVKFMSKDWRQYKKSDWGNDVYTLFL